MNVLTDYARNNVDNPTTKQAFVDSTGTIFAGRLSETFALTSNEINMLFEDYFKSEGIFAVKDFNIDEVKKAVSLLILDLYNDSQ